jgi:hypothetical protein
VGLRTRITTALSFVLGGYLLCLPHNFGKVHHFDAPLVLVMGILAASRTGDALSVDRWRARGTTTSAPDPSSEYTWPVRAAWMVLALVLFGAGVSKVRHGGIAWLYPDNLAIRFLSHQYHIANADPLTSWGLHLARVPWLCSLLAGLTIVIECGFPLALVSPWARCLLVPSSLLMIMGIRLLLGPSFESYLALYPFFVPWNRILARGPRPGAGVRPASPAAAAEAAEASRVRRLALGSRAGQPGHWLRSTAVVTATGRRSARLEGFSLHADVAVPACRRDSGSSKEPVRVFWTRRIGNGEEMACPAR